MNETEEKMDALVTKLVTDKGLILFLDQDRFMELQSIFQPGKTALAAGAGGGGCGGLVCGCTAAR